MKSYQKPFVQERPKQAVPADIVEDLLQSIRGAFYGDLEAKQWHQEKRFLTRVVTWPAKWLTSRAVSLPPERYKAIVLEILDGVKIHGTDQVKHWPGYLLSCVQKHFAMHGDEYYEEGKSVRAAAERALANVGRRPADPIEALAAVHQVLTKRPQRKAIAAPKQPSLFAL